MTGRLAALSPIFLGLMGLAGPLGCSSFERDWQALAKAPPSADPILGRWNGTWESKANGHSGKLRAIVAPREDGGYDARYHATYGCCFTFQYTASMTAQKEGEALRFTGSADLGWLAGGIYEYEGTATALEFHSTYRSRVDHGEFRMARPGG